MYMLKQIMFFLKRKKILKNIQYLLSKNLDGKLSNKTITSINFIRDCELRYEQLGAKSSLCDILFSQLHIKKQELINVDIETVLQLIQENRNLINAKRHLFDKNTYDALILNIDYLKFKVEIKSWFNDVGYILKSKSLLIDEMENSKIEICDKLDRMEFNSPEYVELKKEHVALNIEIAKIKTAPILDGDIILSNLGKAHVSFANMIIDRTLRTELLGLLPLSKSLVISKDNEGVIDIYNDLLIDKLKVEFYLTEESKTLFVSVQKLMISLLQSKIENPLNYLIEYTNGNVENQFNYTKGIQEKTFKYYLNCFVLTLDNVGDYIKINLIQLDRVLTEDELKTLQSNKGENKDV